MLNAAHGNWQTAVTIIVSIIFIVLIGFGVFLIVKWKWYRRYGKTLLSSRYWKHGLIIGILSIPLLLGIVFLLLTNEWITSYAQTMWIVGWVLFAIGLSSIIAFSIIVIILSNRRKRKSMVLTTSNVISNVIQYAKSDANNATESDEPYLDRIKSLETEMKALKSELEIQRSKNEK